VFLALNRIEKEKTLVYNLINSIFAQMKSVQTQRLFRLRSSKYSMAAISACQLN